MLLLSHFRRLGTDILQQVEAGSETGASAGVHLGGRWNMMSDTERAPYEDKARQLKEKLMAEHPDYKYSPRRRGSRDSDHAATPASQSHSPLVMRRRHSRTQLLSDDEDLISSARSLSPQSYGSSRDTSPARPPILSPQRRASNAAIGRSPQFLTVPQLHHMPQNYSLVLVPNDILHTIQPLMPPMTQVPVVAEARPPPTASSRREAFRGRKQQQISAETFHPPSLVQHGRMQSLPTILPSFSITSQSSELTEECISTKASTEQLLDDTLLAYDPAPIDSEIDMILDGINLRDIIMNDLGEEMAPDEDAVHAWFAEDMMAHEADSSLVFEF